MTPTPCCRHLKKRRVLVISEMEDIRNDSAGEWYGPTDNFLDINGSTYNDRKIKRRFTIDECYYWAYNLLGLPYRAAVILANDAVRNKMDYRDADGESAKNRNQLIRFNRTTDLWNQVDRWVEYNNVYGLGFLVKYWGDGEQNFKEVPPNAPPTRFQAMSPRFIHPLRRYDTDLLDLDTRKWKFVGGVFKGQMIHPDRIEVLATRRLEGDWRGLSMFDPVKLPLLMYYNSLINVGRGLRKWGKIVPALKMADYNINKYKKYIEIAKKYEANLIYLLEEDDDIDFLETKLGKGIQEPIEILRESLCSAWGIPLNQLLGRSVSGGIGGEGAVISKQDYAQTIGNLQKDITWNLRNVYIHAGFDMSDTFCHWNLAIQKTREQELKEEKLELENEMLKKKIEQMEDNAVTDEE